MSTQAPEVKAPVDLFQGDWKQRLETVVETMRQVSIQRDPETMVNVYSEQMRRMNPIDRLVSVSRRGLERPWYRIARNTGWEEHPNPWLERGKLPVLEGGLVGELVYGEKPVLIDEIDVAADDPAASCFEGMRSLISIPVFDAGQALNTVLLMRRQRAAFDRQQFPLQVLLSNLFGRATHNLVLSDELRKAHAHLDRQTAIVGEIQRSLLPAELPVIPHLGLSVHYEAAENAGGDYYDVLPLGDGRWAILVADVSGHGTPAAVLMAITRVITHMAPKDLATPGTMLAFLNCHLAESYTGGRGAFVTAFCCIFHPETRVLDYALAGHPPPRLKRCSDQTLHVVDGRPGPPLGVLPECEYVDHALALRPGDQLALYTDGITEARNPEGALFGPEGLDRALHDCQPDAAGMMRAIVGALERFTNGRPADDDRTLLVARVS